MLVIVAYRIAFESLVGPSQAATRRLLPCASSRLIASPATTGSSTSRPKAMINEAIDICWISRPSNCMKPNVMATVTGIEIAMTSAERSSKPFDLVALTHFHGYGDGTPAAPTARVPVRIERKKTRRVLVTSARDSEIAQIQQSSVAGLANSRAIDVRQRPEFVRLL